MKTFDDIKDKNENEVVILLDKGEISLNTFDEYFKKTSIHQRVLRNNEVWCQLTV